MYKRNVAVRLISQAPASMCAANRGGNSVLTTAEVLFLKY